MHFTTVLTIMRLTVFALFIALPAAAYAAVCPLQQLSMGHTDNCAKRGEDCHTNVCCSGICVTYDYVRLSASDLLLANWEVRHALVVMGVGCGQLTED